MRGPSEVPTSVSPAGGWHRLLLRLPLLLIILWTGCGGGSSGGGGGGGAGGGKTTTPPAQPTDITPINGEVYYVLNQFSALQADLIGNSVNPGEHVIQQPGSFSSLSQRWAFTSLAGGTWKISNVSNGFCLDSSSSAGVTWVVQNPCAATATQQWMLAPARNGYYTITNTSTGLLIDLFQARLPRGPGLTNRRCPAPPPKASSGSCDPRSSVQWTMPRSKSKSRRIRKMACRGGTMLVRRRTCCKS